MGNTCKPMVDSFECMTKSTTIKKKGKKNKNKNVFGSVHIDHIYTLIIYSLFCLPRAPVLWQELILGMTNVK